MSDAACRLVDLDYILSDPVIEGGVSAYVTLLVAATYDYVNASGLAAVHDEPHSIFMSLWNNDMGNYLCRLVGGDIDETYNISDDDAHVTFDDVPYDTSFVLTVTNLDTLESVDIPFNIERVNFQPMQFIERIEFPGEGYVDISAHFLYTKSGVNTAQFSAMMFNGVAVEWHDPKLYGRIYARVATYDGYVMAADANLNFAGERPYFKLTSPLGVVKTFTCPAYVYRDDWKHVANKTIGGHFLNNGGFIMG